MNLLQALPHYGFIKDNVMVSGYAYLAEINEKLTNCFPNSFTSHDNSGKMVVLERKN